eukprot:4220871-Pleurochrysis_carterae.AAC.1
MPMDDDAAICGSAEVEIRQRLAASVARHTLRFRIGIVKRVTTHLDSKRSGDKIHPRAPINCAVQPSQNSTYCPRTTAGPKVPRCSFRYPIHNINGECKQTECKQTRDQCMRKVVNLQGFTALPKVAGDKRKGCPIIFLPWPRQTCDACFHKSDRCAWHSKKTLCAEPLRRAGGTRPTLTGR